jgi:hypothetical protein
MKDDTFKESTNSVSMTVVHIERNNYSPSQMIAVNPRMPNARRQVQPRVRQLRLWTPEADIDS